jgi:hypothetical protein
MSNTSQPSDVSQAIQEPAPTQAPSVPASTTAKEPARLLVRRLARLDWALVVGVLLLAGLLGFCAAHFSRLWMHLAVGRLLAEGQYQFGVDPFAWGTEGLYWVNGSWLADLLFYAIYSLADGTGLIVFKSFLVVLLALVLLRVRRSGESWWAAAFCTGLALVAMSSRFQVDPFLFSLVLLGVTTGLLFHESERPRRLWLLPPLFALWANLDSWFLLGPLTVALVLFGQWLQQIGPRGEEARPDRRRLRTLALILPVGLLACLVNPHLHRVFVLPMELADLVLRTGAWPPSGMLAAGAGLREIIRLDPHFQPPLWMSPLSSEYWSYTARGLNVAGLAYFPLLLLGLVSFALTTQMTLTAQMTGKDRVTAYPWPRLLLWSFFALLSIAQARLIPLFAVVAGPLTALNLQDFRRQALVVPRLGRPWRLWSLGGRVGTLLGLLTLAVLTWPGWLHPPQHFQAHRVAWQLQPDPLLREAAEYLSRWQGESKLGPGFNYNPDIANYCAWFGPQAKPYYDGRFDLFVDRAKDIGQLRQAVRELVTAGPDGLPLDPSQLGELLRKRGLDHLILTDYSRDLLVYRAASQLLWQGQQRWPMLHADGRTVVFGCPDPAVPEQARRFEKIAEAPAALAFGPRQPLPPLPDSSRPFVAEPDFWRDLLVGPPPPSGEIDRAKFWSEYFDTLARRKLPLREAVLKYGVDQSIKARVSLAGTLAPTIGPLAGVAAVAGIPPGSEPRLDLQDIGPAAAPLLAMQAARRATFANPTNADAYFQLLGAIERLWTKQESHWAQRSPHDPSGIRAELRRLQWTAAAKAVLRLDPDRKDLRNYQLHLRLGAMYHQDLHYLDVALKHYEKALAILHQYTPPAAEAKTLQKERKGLEAVVKRLSDDLERRKEWLEVRALDRGLQEKVALALLAPYDPAGSGKGGDSRGAGLALQALQFLQSADPAHMTLKETQFNLYWQQKILLNLGEVKQIHDWLEDPATKKHAGLRYAEGKLYLSATVGDYRQFDKFMQEAAGPLPKIYQQERAKDLVNTLFRPTLLGQLALDPRLPTIPLLRPAEFLTWQGWLGGHQMQLATWRAFLANHYFVRGLMALEDGDTALALHWLRQARDLLPADEQVPDRGILERYLSLLEQQQKE